MKPPIIAKTIISILSWGTALAFTGSILYTNILPPYATTLSRQESLIQIEPARRVDHSPTQTTILAEPAYITATIPNYLEGRDFTVSINGHYASSTDQEIRLGYRPTALPSFELVPIYTPELETGDWNIQERGDLSLYQKTQNITPDDKLTPEISAQTTIGTFFTPTIIDQGFTPTASAIANTLSASTTPNSTLSLNTPTVGNTTIIADIHGGDVSFDFTLTDRQQTPEIEQTTVTITDAFSNTQTYSQTITPTTTTSTHNITTPLTTSRYLITIKTTPQPNIISAASADTLISGIRLTAIKAAFSGDTAFLPTSTQTLTTKGDTISARAPLPEGNPPADTPTTITHNQNPIEIITEPADTTNLQNTTIIKSDQETNTLTIPENIIIHIQSNHPIAEKQSPAPDTFQNNIISIDRLQLPGWSNDIQTILTSYKPNPNNNSFSIELPSNEIWHDQGKLEFVLSAPNLQNLQHTIELTELDITLISDRPPSPSLKELLQLIFSFLDPRP